MTNFSLVIDKTWNIKKNNTDTTNGIPNPPILIIAPRGAPIKNNKMQANDNVSFLCHSILCFMINDFLLSKSFLYMLTYILLFLTWLIAVSIILILSLFPTSSGIGGNSLSVSFLDLFGGG